jgi:hypothetical protein
MILGGGQCQKCKCIPCDPCAKECTEPHTGDAFEVVYTRYFEGAEAGNTTDGYLTATGDSDTSDPFDGMDGDGPWYQRVSGGFTFSPTGTRLPCSIRVSFWRNSYTLGPNTVPPPAATLTENTIEVIVDEGALVTPDGTVITPADGVVGVSSVPLVAAGGDASTADPRSGGGTVSFYPKCNNVETTFTVRATIRWNTKQRQHVLYGLVRECYEEGTPCGTFCDGDPAPDTLYVTISNYTGLEPDSPYVVEGTYVVERFPPGICNSFNGVWPAEGGCQFGPIVLSSNTNNYVFINVTPSTLELMHATKSGGQCVSIRLVAPLPEDRVCGADLPLSGTNGVAYQANFASPSDATYTTTVRGAFDWEISE